MTSAISRKPLDTFVEPLTEAELASLRTALEECRNERLRQISVETDSASADYDPIAVTNAVAARQTLAMIDSALLRMDSGAYGRCVECEFPIPAPRLELMPWADLCVSCRQRRGARG